MWFISCFEFDFEGLILRSGRPRLFLVVRRDVAANPAFSRVRLRQNSKVRESAHFRTTPKSMRWERKSIVEP
jgi:hypothetical protein